MLLSVYLSLSFSEWNLLKMTNLPRLRRSALYMPCSNTRALEKAQTLDADVLLFDLEDAVALDAKETARSNIADALDNKDYGFRERVVRVNHIDTHWGYDDLKALQNKPLDGLCLPKVESPEQVNQALAVLGHEVPVWAMIETPLGIVNVEAIAAHPQVAVLIMGTNDLAKELRVEQSSTRSEFFYAFGKAVMAARAFNCEVLDGVYNQLDNAEELLVLCKQGKALGFDGKTLIHPKQLAASNEVFSPGKDEVEAAQEIIAAWDATADKGVIVVNGRIVEGLHVESAQRTLALHQVMLARS